MKLFTNFDDFLEKNEHFNKKFKTISYIFICKY